MTGCEVVDVPLLLAWMPIIVIVGAGIMLLVACLIVEWDRHLAAKARRAAEAQRRWAGMNRNDR